VVSRLVRVLVEVAGIEPASFVVVSGLLRAQPAQRSTRPRRSRRQVADGPSRGRCPRTAPRPFHAGEPPRWGQDPGRRHSRPDPSL